jgi:NAD-dependent dihydropyrimidine dehydrogenase PreA subunit
MRGEPVERLSYQQILIGEQMVGLWGLRELFDELHALGRAPEPGLAPLLLEGVERANYVFPKARPLYEEALLREYRRHWKQHEEQNQATEKRPPRLSPRTWRGKPREQVPWYPSIYPERCDGCGDCLVFCEYEVYSWDEASHKAIVVDPFNCLVGCDACAKVCKRGAIRFPPREMLRTFGA